MYEHLKARTVSGRVDGWHVRSIQRSTVITGSVAAAGLLSDRNIESIVFVCGKSGARRCGSSRQLFQLGFGSWATLLGHRPRAEHGLPKFTCLNLRHSPANVKHPLLYLKQPAFV